MGTMGESSAADWPLGAAATNLAAETDAADRPRALTPGEVAWIALVPCALLMLAVVVLLGPPLGNALLAPRGLEFWPSVFDVQAIRPEPVEHARYLLALLGPLLLCAAILARRSAPRLAPRQISGLVVASQALTVLALAAFLIAQRQHVYEEIYAGPLRRIYFTASTLIVAFVLLLLLVGALRRQTLVDRVTGWLRETSARRGACAAVAIGFTALWLLASVFLDSSVGRSIVAINVTLPFSLDEGYAVLNGRTPLVDFHAQYAQLWPYVAALAMSVFGASITTYTIAMASGTALVLLAVYATLRRVVGSSLGALALYLPFVATSF
ncbi:MAG TPA: hypothetical protein VK506_13510, partial [Conexibacter sp.]|nr:hypothetical protein [Conexibacter sp.]